MVYLYKLSALYASLLKLIGYERGISRFIDRLELDCPRDLRMLDVGCGSGIVGLRFLERFPGATLLATDLEPNFLKATLANARSRGLDEKRIEVGLSDINAPDQVTLLDGDRRVLDKQSFDIVSVGGVLGYSQNQQGTIETLLSLIKPGGYLVDLEMSESPAGSFVSKTYHCTAMPLESMRTFIEAAGHRVCVVPFSLANFPANLTRIGIIAKVSGPDQATNFAPAAVLTQTGPPYGSKSDFDYST